MGTQQTLILAHNIYSLSFQNLCDNCWKECLSPLVESLSTVSHDALQLLVNDHLYTGQSTGPSLSSKSHDLQVVVKKATIMNMKQNMVL